MVFVSDFFINKGRQYLFHRSAVEANEATCMWKPFRYLEGCARVRSLQCPAWETPQPFSGTRLVATVMVIRHTSKNCCQPLREATRRQPGHVPPAVPLPPCHLLSLCEKSKHHCWWLALHNRDHDFVLDLPRGCRLTSCTYACIEQKKYYMWIGLAVQSQTQTLFLPATLRLSNMKYCSSA